MLSFEFLPMALYRQPYSYPLASDFYVVYLRFYHCSKAKLRVVRTGTLPEQKNKTNDDLISIEGVLKPALVRFYDNDTSPNASLQSAKCINIFG